MEIHQLLTCLSYGDAISNYSLQIRDYIRSWGYSSDIYTEESHPNVRGEVKHFRTFLERSGNDQDVLLYHFSVGSVISHYLKKLTGKKIMIYHNITPQDYFINIHPYLVSQIVHGREELREYASVYSLAIADSEYNKEELEQYGYKNVVCIPLKLSTENLDTEPDPFLMDFLRDGKKNILFVGRVTPNKGHADLIKSFYFLNRAGYTNTRLIMVGEFHGFENYYWWLEKLCVQLKLDNVLFPGLVDYDELAAYYRTADMFVCLSQHEGFCVPLIEAMYFNIPVVALSSTAVPYTLRNAGLAVSSIDYHRIAELMALVIDDQDLRERILSGQKSVLDYYQNYDLEQNLKKALEPYLV